MNPNNDLVNFQSVPTGQVTDDNNITYTTYVKKLVMNKVTILPILPSISYTYEF